MMARILLCFLKFAFGPEPILHIMPVFASPSQVESICTLRNSIFG